jgi:mitosis inhibitor protein kinase SWE1
MPTFESFQLISARKEWTYLFIQMELCQKESLHGWLRGDKRTKGMSLNMFREICLGVQYVHEQGLMHRDLKPANIFLSIGGTIKIGDFGLVTMYCDTAAASGSGEVIAHAKQ